MRAMAQIGRVWSGMVAVVPLALLVFSADAYGQACETVLNRAEAHYTDGAFSDAITVLSPCIRSFPPGSEEDRAAHRLLALAYLRSDQIEEARLVIVELFARNPGYEADPVNDPPAFVSLVNLVREETGARADGSNGSGGGGSSPLRTWFQSPRGWLIMGGSAVAATAAILLINSSGGGGGPEPLPMPPAFP